MSKIQITIGISIACIGLIMLSYLYFPKIIEQRLLYPGAWQREVTPTPRLPTDNTEMWTHRGVEAWFIPAFSDKVFGTVLFAHGNGELIDDWPQFLAPYYTSLGFNLLLVEYRGYGRSKGQPELHAIVDDMRVFRRRARERMPADAKWVYHGRSLGGGIVGQLSLVDAPDVLILESTFSSLRTIAREKFGWLARLMTTEMDTFAALNTLSTPTLILHGERDTLIPPSHAVALNEAAGDNGISISLDCGHNDCHPHSRQTWTSIAESIHQN